MAIRCFVTNSVGSGATLCRCLWSRHYHLFYNKHQNLSNLEFTIFTTYLSTIMAWTATPVSKIDFPLRFPNPNILTHLLFSKSILYNRSQLPIISHLPCIFPWKKIDSYSARREIFWSYRTRAVFWCGWIQSISSHSVSLRSVNLPALYQESTCVNPSFNF